MSQSRRTIDRRRRVLYTTQQADQTTPTAASRRAAEQLREARRPTAAYAARVHRRLRGRWFSLVPVKRRTLIAVASALFAVAMLLSFAHYAAAAWPSIANLPEIARPLRLDRADSFGRWITCVMLTASAGTALMIYQVRRYRVDDYTGQYRIWRLVLIVMFIASVDSMVSLTDWFGAILDTSLGQRVALSGKDWLQIILSIGGAVLALRLIAEVRRSRWSLVTMIAAWSVMAIPVAAKWNIFEVDTVAKWSLVTSSPLIACTILFVSLGGYLRMLFRQVRNLDEKDLLSERFQNFKVSFFSRHEKEEEAGEAASIVREASVQKRKTKPIVEEKTTVVLDQPTDEVPKRRRWWSREKKKVALADPSVPVEDLSVANDELNSSDGGLQKKRRWFGLRAPKPETIEADETDVAHETRLQKTPEQEPNSTETKKDESSSGKKRGLGGWLGRAKSKSDPAVAARSGDSSSEDDLMEDDESADDDQGSMGDDGVDWDSLSKTERRKMRKQMKRQGRAA